MMGLDTTHDCWHGSYSAFNIWRNTIAASAGYKLKSIGMGLSIVDIDLENVVSEKRSQGDWEDSPPDDPLLILIVHSDCDGIIPHELLKPLSDRLEEILSKIQDKHISTLTEKFINGLKSAYEAGEDVIFS